VDGDVIPAFSSPATPLMRAVIQRVSSARVTVAGELTGEIAHGLLVLLGVAPADLEADARWLAEKICALRIFEDGDGKMNRSVTDVAGGVLVVSQFTLLASTRKGTRPSFNDAAKPDLAIPLYETFNRIVGEILGRPVATGRFAAMMEVALVNDGPVTLVIDSKVRE
jgi:D-tyrosyl-tRNA(Tyr) deacylase